MKNILIFCFFSLLFSQNGYIKGTVVSDSGKILPGANVYIKGTDKGTACDLEGNFKFMNLESGKYDLKVDYIGYKEGSITFYISSYTLNEEDDNKNILLEKIGIEDDSQDLDILKAPYHDDIKIVLIKDALGLEEVTVAASKVKQKITEAPGVVSILNAKSIRRRVGDDDYNRLASFLKGVDVSYFGIQGAQINARGFDGAANTRFRQYEDGVYLGELVTSLVFSQLAGPPKESIKKIEVLFGPQSALYGPDATQGLLNIIKKHPREDKTNEVNFSAHSSDKFRLGGRFAKAYNKLAYDLVYEFSYAGELEYNNCFENCENLDSGQRGPIFYATDENNDGDYDDIGIDGTPESDTLRSDYYKDMDQKKNSIRTNLYYTLPNDAEISLGFKYLYGEGYALGSAGPIYLTNSVTNTLSLKYTSNRSSLKYTFIDQDSDVLQRDLLARFQAVNPELSWEETTEKFPLEDDYWVTVYDGVDQYLDYQFNSNLTPFLHLVTGFDLEFKDPFTNRTGIKDNGFDNFKRQQISDDEDIKEYRYGIYAQLMTKILEQNEITASIRYDNHEYYGEMFSPKIAFVNKDFFNGSLKLLAGQGFKAPTIVDRNIYNGIVDAFAGTSPWDWTIQGKAMGNKYGYTVYDFYDVGNGQRDEYESYIDANYGFVGEGNLYQTSDECINAGGSYDPLFNTCGNGTYDFIDINGNGNLDSDESYELYWELDGDGKYGPEDILIDSNYIRPLEIEKFTSYEIAYLGAINKNTLIDVNAYYGTYENFKSPLRAQGITGPFFFNDGAPPFSIKQINQGSESVGGHPINDTNDYVYLLTYESMPITIHYKGFELGLKHIKDKYEISANFSYFDDSDLVSKREKAEKYFTYVQYPDSIEINNWSSFEKYKNFNKVYSNTSNLKFNSSITLIEPFIKNLDIMLNIKGVTPFDFVSGYFQATEKYKGELYNPVEGFKVDEGRVGGGLYLDLNLTYNLNDIIFGASVKNILEANTVSFPMTPSIPRTFVFEIGYQF